MKRFFTLLCIAASFYFNSTPLSAQAVDVNDSLALVDLYNSTNGPNWGYASYSWLQGPVHLWEGITLTPNLTRVKKIDLHGENLRGQIPASLGNLSNLESLSLWSNYLTGTIPVSLGNLSNLQSVYLDYNQLTGEIPASLGLLPNLINLDLNANHLSGKIPATFVSTPNLTRFHIDHNKFTFDGIEAIVQRNLQSFVYYAQDTTLPIHRRNDTLFVSAGGVLQNNTYKWGGASSPYTIIAGDSFFVPTNTDDYYVTVHNSIATGFDLNSNVIHNTLVDFLDPNLTSLVNSDGSLGTYVSNDNAYRTVRSAATDGATKLLIVSYAYAQTPVTYKLAPGSEGMLSSLTDQNTFSKQITVPVSGGYGRAIAIYTVPDGYGKSNPADKFVDITAVANGDTIGHNKLRLIKPPVVLVHGMWSNPEVWEKGKLTRALSDSGFQHVFLADYENANASTFNPASPASLPGRTAVANATKEALAYYRSIGAAATQVDVIGHSLGGLMTRSWSQQPNFKRTDNFQKGYVHKLITLSTPHRGAPIGPELVASQNNLIHLPYTNFTLPVIPLSFVLALAGMPIGPCHADFGVTSPGIMALSATPPYHTYSIVGDQAGQILGYAAFYAFSIAALNHNYFDIFRAHAPCTNILDHDLVVPTSSQRGYITKSQTFYATGHSIPAFTTVTNSPEIHIKLIKLLLSDDAAEFANGFPAPSTFPLDCTTANQRVASSSSPVNRSVAARTADTLSANSGIRITSPARGAVYQQHSSASINLKYEKFGDAKPGNCMFLIQGLGWYTITDSVNNSTTITLPDSSSVGKLNIVLLGRDSTGVLLGDTLSITVNPYGTLDSLAIEPTVINLDSAQRERSANVHGYYIGTNNDTLKNNISSAASGTTYQAKVGNVFNVTKDGLVMAKAVGSDTLIVRKGSETVKARVTVNGNFSYVNLYPNIIDFPQPPNVYVGDAPFALSATSAAGNDVVYTVLSGPATVANGVITVGNVTGTVTIQASATGTSYFGAAPNVTRTFNVSSGTTYTFLGSGNWSNAANWQNNVIPPSTLPASSRIIVNPVDGGECILNVTQHISANNNLIIKAGKDFKVMGNLIINR